jgi:O-antigen/teichoic acid export membrane protein
LARAGGRTVSETGSSTRRLSTITIDQAIAGGSNVLIAVLAARILDTALFGYFGLVLLLYGMVLAASRALVGGPLLVHPDEARDRTREVIGSGVVVGVLFGLIVLVLGLLAQLWDPRLGQAVVVLAVFMPWLVLQDVGRFIGFALRQPALALKLDVAWLLLLLVGVAVLAGLGVESLSWFIATWAGSGAVAGAGLFFRRGDKAPRLGVSWLRTTWSYSWRYLVGSVASQGSMLAGASGVGAVAGARELGSGIGATLMVRPFMTFQIAAMAAGVSDIANDRSDGATVMRHVKRTTVVTTSIAVINTLIMVFLPDVLGRLVLGETWDYTKTLLLAAGVQIVMLGLITGPRAALLGLGIVRVSIPLDIISSLLYTVLMVIGAYINGALGATWAVAGGLTAMTAVWWMAFAVHRDRGVASSSDAASELADGSLS